MFLLELFNNEMFRDMLRAWLIFTSLYYIGISFNYILLLLLSLKIIIKSKGSKKAEKTKPDHQMTFKEGVSIIVPAYNEEISIVDSIKNSLTVDYPNFEIIVINDGSKDKTLEMVIKSFQMKEIDYSIDINHILLRNIIINKIYKSTNHPNLILIDKVNGGKASALNTGIYFSKYDYFCAVDADSIIMKDALKKTMTPIGQNKNVIAVGGILRVGNGIIDQNGNQLDKNMNFDLLPLLQTIEYERDFKLGRLGWYALKSTILVSGAFGLFNKQAVSAVGGYNLASIGEDLELLMRMHNIFCKSKENEYKVMFIPEETCWTETPSSYKVLYNQRNRWHRGLMDSFTINQDVLLNPDHGSVGLLSVPYYFFAELYGPVIKYLNYLLIFLAILAEVVSLKIFLLVITISFLFRIIINFSTLLLDNLYFNEKPRVLNFIYLAIASVIDGIGYKQFISFATFSGFVDYYTPKQGWGKMERKGMINQKK